MKISISTVADFLADNDTIILDATEGISEEDYSWDDDFNRFADQADKIFYGNGVFEIDWDGIIVSLTFPASRRKSVEYAIAEIRGGAAGPEMASLFQEMIER